MFETFRVRNWFSRKQKPEPLFLVKDSDDLISWCRCEVGIAGSPGQLDCPWCGCGWLFTCVFCRKAFTFARAATLDHTYESLGRADLEGRWGRSPSDKDLAAWVDFMTRHLARLVRDQRYVYLDANYLRVADFPAEIDGMYARHAFDEAPQLTAMRDKSVFENVLANRDYWVANARDAKA